MCADWFVTQAISAQDEKLAQTMFLPLAERMVEKMVKEEKIEAEAEVSAVSLTPHILDSSLSCRKPLFCFVLFTVSICAVPHFKCFNLKPFFTSKP